VFGGKKGKPLDPDNLVKREFQPALDRAELRHIRFHDLRHTYASLLRAVHAGAPAQGGPEKRVRQVPRR